MHVISTITWYYSPAKMTKMRKKKEYITPVISKDVEQLVLSHPAGKM